MAEDENKNLSRFTKLEKKVDEINSVDDNRWDTIKQEISELKERVDYFQAGLIELKDEFNGDHKKVHIEINKILRELAKEISELKERVEGIFKSIHGINDGDVKSTDSTHILVKCPKCKHKYLINKEGIL